MVNQRSNSTKTSRAVLAAHTLKEIDYYLMVTPCSFCGKGPQVIAPGEDPALGESQRVKTRCRHCNQGNSLEVIFSHEKQPDSELINPTDKPSEIVDLSQWLSVASLLSDEAFADRDNGYPGRKGYQAMLCFCEALKFYEDNELPPLEAFFSEATLEIFHEHPEQFARQRLRDMQARLPGPIDLDRTDPTDENRYQSSWWKFWQ